MMGAGDTLDHDNVYQSMPALRSNLIGIGWWRSGSNAIIRYSELHDSGQCWQYDHAIYLAGGSGAQIYDNWIWNQHGGQAISIYPDPRDAHIYRNVIDSSASGFGLGSNAAKNTLDHNVVSNSGFVTYDFGAATFAGMFMNCISGPSANRSSYSDSYNNPGGTTITCRTKSQITWSNMFSANPRYVDRLNHNYTVRATSPLAHWGLPSEGQVGP